MRIRDLVKYMPPDELAHDLRRKAKSIDGLCAHITSNFERNELNVALLNIAKRVSLDLSRLARFQSEPADLIAFCTRSLFELNLIARFIIQSEDNLRSWMSQFGTDEMEILQGLQRLTDSGSHQTVLQSRIDEIKRLLGKHDLSIQSYLSTSQLAKRVDANDEYSSLHKLYSKYIHPSSWLINGNAERTDSWEYRNILTIKGQLYAGDTFQRLAAKYNYQTR